MKGMSTASCTQGWEEHQSAAGHPHRRRPSRMVSTFVIILRELGGGHGEMNAPCSSEELQTAPGEDFVS